jgi:hypothetical protein
MSGYLRRLAATARNPRFSIRPVVGSLFSGQSIDSTPESVESEERTEIYLPRTPPLQGEIISRSAGGPDPGVSEIGPPRLATFGESALQSGAKSDPSERPPAQRQTTLEEAAAPDADTKTERPFIRREYLPLILEKIDGDDLKRGSVQNPPVAPTRTGNGRRDPHRLSEIVERQPDEIQIHIGRIEVTALPPPVSRLPAKPAPKSLSLDDYLKRGRRH